MLKTLPYTVTPSLISELEEFVPSADYKITLNEPNGNFFYDPWSIKLEYKGTVWERILNTLPIPFGEARLITLTNGTTYMSHTDIDDRYHLNLKGQYSYLIDIDNEKMFPTTLDYQWYEMDTSRRHVAANFGSYDRVQIVIRKLLQNATLKDFRKIKISPICINPRFEFDDIISPWLNLVNKRNLMANFNILKDGVEFNLDSNILNELEFIPNDKFKVFIF